MIALLFFLSGMISLFSRVFTPAPEQEPFDMTAGIPGYLGLFGFSLY